METLVIEMRQHNSSGSEGRFDDNVNITTTATTTSSSSAEQEEGQTFVRTQAKNKKVGGPKALQRLASIYIHDNCSARIGGPNIHHLLANRIFIGRQLKLAVRT